MKELFNHLLRPLILCITLAISIFFSQHAAWAEDPFLEVTLDNISALRAGLYTRYPSPGFLICGAGRIFAPDKISPANNKTYKSICVGLEENSASTHFLNRCMEEAQTLLKIKRTSAGRFYKLRFPGTVKSLSMIQETDNSSAVVYFKTGSLYSCALTVE